MSKTTTSYSNCWRAVENNRYNFRMLKNKTTKSLTKFTYKHDVRKMGDNWYGVDGNKG